MTNMVPHQTNINTFQTITSKPINNTQIYLAISCLPNKLASQTICTKRSFCNSLASLWYLYCFANSIKNPNLRQTVSQDMSSALNTNQWKLSCYSPFSNKVPPISGDNSEIFIFSILIWQFLSRLIKCSKTIHLRKYAWQFMTQKKRIIWLKL